MGERMKTWTQAEAEKMERRDVAVRANGCYREGQFSSVQSLSHVWPFATPWTAAHQASLSITNSQSWPNSCPLSWWCHPTVSSAVIPFPSCLQSFPASRSFPMESVLRIRWPKYWSFSFSIGPSNEYSGLISFRIDWFDFLAVRNYCCGKWLNRLAPLSYHKLLICI